MVCSKELPSLSAAVARSETNPLPFGSFSDAIAPSGRASMLAGVQVAPSS